MSPTLNGIQSSVTISAVDETILPSKKEDESTVDSSAVVAREEGDETVQKLLHEVADETLNQLIDTIDDAEYDFKEVSVQFSESQAIDNLPICYMPKDKQPWIRVKVSQAEAWPLLNSGADMTVLSYVYGKN